MSKKTTITSLYSLADKPVYVRFSIDQASGDHLCQGAEPEGIWLDTTFYPWHTIISIRVVVK